MKIKIHLIDKQTMDKLKTLVWSLFAPGIYDYITRKSPVNVFINIKKLKMVKL